MKMVGEIRAQKKKNRIQLKWSFFPLASMDGCGEKYVCLSPCARVNFI